MKNSYLRENFTIREIFEAIYANKLKLFFFILISILFCYFVLPTFRSYSGSINFVVNESYGHKMEQTKRVSHILEKVHMKIGEATFFKFKKCDFVTNQEKINRIYSYVDYEDKIFYVKVNDFKSSQSVKKCLESFENLVNKYYEELKLNQINEAEKYLYLEEEKLKHFESSEFNFTPDNYHNHPYQHKEMLKKISIYKKKIHEIQLTELVTRDKHSYIDEHLFRPSMFWGVGAILGILLFILYFLLNILNNYIKLLNRVDK